MESVNERALEIIEAVSAQIASENLVGKCVKFEYKKGYTGYIDGGLVLYENANGLGLMLYPTDPEFYFLPWASIGLIEVISEPEEQIMALYKLAKKHSRNPAGFILQ
jgi:hypothetical protein